MTLQTARRHDGRAVRYRDEPLGEGGMKVVYLSADGQSVIGLYKDSRFSADPGRMQRLEAVLGRHNPTIEAKTGAFWQGLFCWPTAIVTEPTLGVIAPVFPENYYFASGPFAGKEKQGTWFSRSRLRSMLPVEERGPWANYLRVGLQLARAVRRLHQSGVAHADLSPRNVLIDPSSGRACIIDIDSLVIPGLYPPEILGTPGYIAPEVLATMHLPLTDAGRRNVSTQTDQHALAVLLYEYLLYRHPLRGPKVNDAESAERDEFLSLGPNALFIEHHSDQSNRPPDLTQPYTVLGQALASLFERAFVNGLHTPEERPAAIEWERALLRTWDRLVPCSSPACDHGAFILSDPDQPACPFCGTKAGPMPVLHLSSARRTGQWREDGSLVLYSGNGIFAWHVTGNSFASEDADPRPLAYAVDADGWRLVNTGLPALAVLDGDEGRAVPIGGSIRLQPEQRLRLAPEPTGRIAEVRFIG